MKTNRAIKAEPIYTHEGGKASHITAFEELSRATMSCLLWEDNFYESGVSIADRITSLTKTCVEAGLYDKVIELLKKVKFDMRLRHCPLWMIVAIYRAGKTVSKDVIASILTRPDDMGELISLYRLGNEKAPIPNAFKKGISIAMQKFDDYQLAKWNRNAKYKLVDIVNLCHPQVTESIDKLVKGTLPTPKTWEVLLSAAGSDKDKKKEAWLDLINTNKLPDMALLKNIRAMSEAGVEKGTIVSRINNIKNGKLLPIDYIRAAQTNPSMENELEQKFLDSFTKTKMGGNTAILVDVSGSMDGERLKYALTMAMIGREMFENVDIYSFSNEVINVPNRRGFALAEAIDKSQRHSGTYMWRAIDQATSANKYERLIVITDEQSMDSGNGGKFKNSYIINVAPYNKGVGYENGIKHINGFSDKIYDYIQEIEASQE